MHVFELVLVLMFISWAIGFIMGHNFHPLREWRMGMAHRFMK